MSTTTSHVPNWKPLETVMTRRGDINECGNFMFMGSREIDGKTKHLYKNKNTRRYLTLDNEGCFYIGNEEITEEKAFDHIYQVVGFKVN